MTPSEFEISLSVQNYDKKTADNLQNLCDAKKSIIFKLPKNINRNF